MSWKLLVHLKGGTVRAASAGSTREEAAEALQVAQTTAREPGSEWVTLSDNISVRATDIESMEVVEEAEDGPVAA